MKLLRLVLEGLPHFDSILDMDFVAQQRVDDDDKERLYNVFSKIYVNQVVAFAGVNASGKTTVLKAASFVMRILNSEPLNAIWANEILKDLSGVGKVTMTAYFYDSPFLYKLETLIGKRVNTVDGSAKYVILDERLWWKEAGRIKTKKSLFDFESYDGKDERNQNEPYLPDDVSIVVALNKKNEGGIFVRDMREETDDGQLDIFGRLPKELLAFLDPGIEYLKCRQTEQTTDIRLKFYGRDEIVINDAKILENYLSAGTIKGARIFANALFTFTQGGCLIIDEIENHFNREIAATLIRFFMDVKVNGNGALLLFSTHYSELLDEFDRNDSIYIVRNRGGISAQNLSDILLRNDMKKSEVYNSDYLGGTVPAYEAYAALRKVLTC